LDDRGLPDKGPSFYVGFRALDGLTENQTQKWVCNKSQASWCRRAVKGPGGKQKAGSPEALRGELFQGTLYTCMELSQGNPCILIIYNESKLKLKRMST
jgi:hypothetical protein